MTIRPIRQVGDPVLRTRTAPVTVFDDALTALVADMFETMYDAPGVGLAANQIGVDLRLFVYDCGELDPDDPDEAAGPGDTGPRMGVLANPRLVELGGRPAVEAGEPDWTDGYEGCLSVVGLGYDTPRWSQAAVEGQDEHGNPVRVAGHGLLARCLQHETDHLDGRLYLDRLVGEQKKAARRELYGT